LTGVEGESTLKAHPNEIHCFSWSWGVSNPAAFDPTAGRIVPGKPNFQDISLTKTVDKSSPALMTGVATGKQYDTAVITILKSTAGAATQDFYVITLSDVVVTSFSTSSGGDTPSESFTLTYTKVNVRYYPTKQDGTLDLPVTFSFDLATNKAS
jgi:type VI secretion system secreted protein Hcp